MRELDPVDTILQIAGGHVLPRCLHVVADLGVADALDEAPRTARGLAESVGANPDPLDRLPAAGCQVRASAGDRRPRWGLHPRGDPGLTS